MDLLVIHPRLDSFLKQVVNFHPKFILDCGAHIGKWSQYLRFLYPEAKILSIEANQGCEEELRRHNLDYEIALVGGTTGEKRTFYKINGGDSSGNSMYRERTPAYDDSNCTSVELTTVTLDEIIARRGCAYPDFVKLDVQGAELEAIAGGQITLGMAEFVLLEAAVAGFNEGAPSFFSLIQAMDKLGFELFDLIEVKHLPYSLCLCNAHHGRLNEMDMLFVKKNSVYRKFADANAGLTDH
jgi:FkbM family methyltransferase